MSWPATIAAQIPCKQAVGPALLFMHIYSVEGEGGLAIFGAQTVEESQPVVKLANLEPTSEIQANYTF